ncbi:MAG TPA: MmcQ/YjbR family DNA-binding protein [Vicinamibacterales bacterium]|nr:MmcQ/YjbR family DNA-binding protein [Vicinamibacterales bacterium]
MTAEDFRRLALDLDGVVESVHMGHPDFRVGGRIFATLHPDDQWGTVKLTPEEQQEFLRTSPRMFVPSTGGWGRQGYTNVRLDVSDQPTVRGALMLAWQNTVSKPRRRSGAKARGAVRKRP